MRNRLTSLSLVLVMAGSLMACGNNNSTNNPTPPSEVSKAPTQFPSEPETGTNINMPDLQLPSDVPMYPGAEVTSKRKTNKISAFSYKTEAHMSEITKFYDEELKKQGWRTVAQLPNSTDGLLYSKGERTVRLITVNLKSKGFREIHLFVAEPDPVDPNAPTGDKNTDEARKYIGNVMDTLQFTNLKSLPAYPDSEQGRSRNGIKYRSFKSKDDVQKIANWYSEQLTKSGWAKYHDTSEFGDSMIIYNKTDQSNNVNYVGVRVNDRKEYRELTLIAYPLNTTIPKLKTTSELVKEQPEAAKAVEEQMKKTGKNPLAPKPVETEDEKVSRQMEERKKAAVEARAKFEAALKAKREAAAAQKK